jgi:uncharacterized protein YukE
MTRQIVILGTSVTVPDPGGVAALAGSFRDVDGSLGDLEGTLQTLTRPDAWGDWTGLAADAFGQSIGQLPGEVADIRDAYGVVSAALQEYAGQIEPVIAALTSLSYRAEDAEGTLTATRNARDQVIAQGHDPRTTGWDARLEEATAAVTSLRGQLSRLVSELDALASTCTRKIAAAEPKPEKKSLLSSLASDFMKDVADPLARAAEAVARADREVADAALAAGVILAKDELRVGEFVVKGAADVVEDVVIRPFADLPGDVAAFIEHPSMETFGQALGGVAGVLGVLAMIPGVDAIAMPLMVAFSAAAAAADWVAVAEHEPGASVMSAAEETLSFGLGGVGLVAKSAVDADSGLFQAAYDNRDLTGLDDLKDGADADASGSALWKAGLQRSFSPADIKDSMSDDFRQLKDPVGLVRSQVSGLRSFGDDGLTHSPAAVQIEHVKWAADQAGNVQTVVEDQTEHRHPAESKKS